MATKLQNSYHSGSSENQAVWESNNQEIKNSHSCRCVGQEEVGRHAERHGEEETQNVNG